MSEPTDHRAAAERWLAEFLDSIAPADPNRQDMLRLALVHALLAQDRDRCTATRGHANGHHWPAEQPASEDRCNGVYSDGYHPKPYRCGLAMGHEPPHLYEPPPIPRAPEPDTRTDDEKAHDVGPFKFHYAD